MRLGVLTRVDPGRTGEADTRRHNENEGGNNNRLHDNSPLRLSRAGDDVIVGTRSASTRRMFEPR